MYERLIRLLLSALCIFATFSTVSAQRGDSQCARNLCVHATVNETEWTYTMETRLGADDMGWMAIGFGTSMSDSQFVIMWPNGNGQYTISHRGPSGHSEPRINPNPPRTARVHQALTVARDNLSIMSFAIRPGPQLAHNIIWAVSGTRPGSNSADATIARHIAQGSMSLNLDKAFVGDTLSTTTAPSATGTAYVPPSRTGIDDLDEFELPPLVPYQRTLMAHGVFCGLGFALILPAGALVGRWLRLFYPTRWFRLHWWIQAGLGIPLIIIGWSLGVAGIVMRKGTHFDTPHKVAGLVLLGLYILQLLLGVHIHLFKPKNFLRPIPMSAMNSGNAFSTFFQMLLTANRPAQNYLHAIVGISIVLLGLYNVYSGVWYEWPNSTGRGELPNSIKHLWMAWVAIICVAYLAGLSLLPRQLRTERKTAQGNRASDGGVPLKPPPVAGAKKVLVRGKEISLPMPLGTKRDDTWSQEGHSNTMENGDGAFSDTTHEMGRATPVTWGRAI